MKNREIHRGDWSLLSSLLEKVQEHSSLLGDLWLVIMLIFRILVLAAVGGTVFKDEQEEFVCNTTQPGCRQTCYNRAFPVSHYRFWVFHSCCCRRRLCCSSSTTVPRTAGRLTSRRKTATSRTAGSGKGSRGPRYVLSVALRLRSSWASGGAGRRSAAPAWPRASSAWPLPARTRWTATGAAPRRRPSSRSSPSPSGRSRCSSAWSSSAPCSGRAAPGTASTTSPGTTGRPSCSRPPRRSPALPCGSESRSTPSGSPYGQRAPVSDSQGEDRLDLSREPLSV